jgi:hypothetical protein
MFPVWQMVIVAILTLGVGVVFGWWLGHRSAAPAAPVVMEPRQDPRIDKLTTQLERLKVACLVTAEPVGKRPADAAARLVRSLGGIDGAVVAAADGLSLSSKESDLERMLAAVVPATLAAWRMPDVTGVVYELTLVTRQGMGVRVRPLGAADGRTLVLASRGGLPSPLLSRAAFADCGEAPNQRSTTPLLSQQVDYGVVAELSRSAERLDARSIFLFSHETMALAWSRRGLSSDMIAALYKGLRTVQRQSSIVLGDQVERIELSGDFKITLARGDNGWWGQVHNEHVLDDLAVRRLEGVLRMVGTSMVA